MPPLNKPFRYYAIKISRIVIFRRTAKKLQLVRSLLYKPRTEFRLEQVTFVGGRVMGCMSYDEWMKRKGTQLREKPLKLTREEFRALDPYMYKLKGE